MSPTDAIEQSRGKYMILHPRRNAKRRLHSLPQHVTDRFPVELVDRVIDFLHNDWLTLNACSLVCSSWLPRSRYHLLSKVFLKPDNIREFFENVDSPKAFLASSHVRGLVLSGISGLDNTSPAFQLGSAYYFNLPLLEHIELRTLTLQMRAFTPWIGRYSHTLTKISLDTVSVDSLAKFLTAVADLSELRQMVIETVWFHDLKTDIRLENDAFPKLHSLFLSVSAISITQWIIKYQHPNAQLRYLHLPVYDDMRATFAANTYRSLASSLFSLSISQHSLPKMDPSDYPSLRTVFFTGRTPDDVLTMAQSFLTRTSSASIEAIIMEMIPDGSDFGTRSAWDDLINILSGPHFRKLKQLRFVLVAYYKQGKHAILQRFQKKGMVGMYKVTVMKRDHRALVPWES